MNEYRSSHRDRPQVNSGEGIQLLLRGEDRLLQSISACAPLPEVLNEICSALDAQIGNVVSLICLREDDAAVLSSIAENPMRFGLYAFCSAGVFAENDELLGSLEMYSCAPRSASLEESQLIGRATCLAAIAISRFMDAGAGSTCCMDRDRPLRPYEMRRPESIN